MSTRDELLRAVVADPDADAPREAFAAWGLAHGDLQGRVARVQLDEVRERRTGTVEAARRLSLEAYDLIQQNREAWASDVLAIAPQSQPQFVRGFVEVVVLDVPTFLARASELYSIAPIRSVQFLDAGPHIDALAASPHLARLVSIEFYNKSLSAALGDSGMRTLVASPHLKKVAIFSAPFNEIGIDGVEVLAASKELPALRHVVLANNPVEDPSERCSFDAINLEVNHNSISLPPLGEALEAKHGRLRWLHSPSEFRMFPPDERDV